MRDEAEGVPEALSGASAEEILRFWAVAAPAARGEARARLGGMVSVLRDDAGEIAGVLDVVAADVGLIAGRRFWVAQRTLRPDARGSERALEAAAFAVLEARFTGGPGEPLGLCLLLDDPREMRRRAEAEWADPFTIYAGYLADGRQVRIAYFAGAKVDG